MENDYNKQELIESYLKGQMSDEALAAFEWQLKVDEELAQEVELHRQLESMLTNVEEGELQDYSSSLLEEARQEEVNNSLTDETVVKQQIGAATVGKAKLNPLWYVLPLIAVLLLFFGIYWLIPDRSIDTVAKEQTAAYEAIAQGKANAVQTQEEGTTAIAANSTEAETVALEPVNSSGAPEDVWGEKNEKSGEEVESKKEVIEDTVEESKKETIEETVVAETPKEETATTTINSTPAATVDKTESVTPSRTNESNRNSRNSETNVRSHSTNANNNAYNRQPVRNSRYTQLGHQYKRGFDSRRPELSAATQLYKQGNYRGAISQLENNHMLNGDGLLLSGICHSELGELRRAIGIFINLINRQGYVAKDEARWQLALAYLKKSDVNKAVRELQRVASNGGVLANKSRQLLSDIQRR